MFGTKKIDFGVCYYPEHWPKELWEDDLDRMILTGIEVIRIAEFAWSKFELEENIFDFTFFDEFLELVSKKDIKVIFCTPTATPPVWLTERYPEVLAVEYDGSVHRHGMRRQYNYNSPIYLEKTKIIVEKLVEHYGHNKSIIGWQIDNELNCVTNEFYAEADHVEFRKFVKNKYKNLVKLNEAWGTNVWNQTYTDWEEVFLPRYAPRKTTNPHLKLDATRFISESVLKFTSIQSEIIRKGVDKDIFVTTNGLFKNIDYNKMVQDSLDFITYDNYPTFGLLDKSNKLKDRRWSHHLSKTRAISSHFGIMEQQAGPGGWVNHHKAPTPKPGQLRLWTFQAIAHGADFISYFRWRTAPYGTEIYWYGILGHDNKDNRRLLEVKKTINDIKKIENLNNSDYQSEIAILHDYDNEWDSAYDVWTGPLVENSERALFETLQQNHIPFNYVNFSNTLSINNLKKYKVIFVPHLTIVKNSMVKLLKRYTEEGGKLVIGARSGYKDENGKCPMLTMPIKMTDLFGIEINDFTFLQDFDSSRQASFLDKKISMSDFNDILTPISSSCKTLATYTEDYYAGEAAITVNSYGKGQAIYCGSSFNQSNISEILTYFNITATFEKMIKLPNVCEIAVRENEYEQYIFVLNYSGDPQKIQLIEEFVDTKNNKKISGTIELVGYDVLVLKKLK